MEEQLKKLIEKYNDVSDIIFRMISHKDCFGKDLEKNKACRRFVRGFIEDLKAIEFNQEPKIKDDVLDVKHILFKTAACGLTQSVIPIVTLAGFKKIESKDNRRFYNIMRELVNVCDKMEVSLEVKINEKEELR